MRKKTFIVLSVLVVVSLLILLNYAYIENYFGGFLDQNIEKWGYVGVFVSVFFLEIFPQPFLSSLLPLSSGFFYQFDLVTLVLVAIVAAMLSNYTAYFIGLKYGNEISDYFISPENFKKAQKWVDSHGEKILILMAMTPLPYFPVLGGLFKLPFWKFTMYAIIPRAIHFMIFSYIIFGMF